MFILYAVVMGLVVGLLVGGRLAGLGEIQLRWSWVILGGLLAQVVLFSAAVSDRVGDLGPPIYIGSTALVIAAILANRAIPGMRLVALGAASNLTAIVVNGGYMPASADAAAALGRAHPTSYSNSAVIPDPILAPLTDIFALPAWLPFANVFSIGDVLIGIGIGLVIVKAMRAGVAAPPAIATSTEGPPLSA
jgi:hypothetical protein